MGVLSLQMDFVGQVAVNPRRGKMITTDNLATITTAGYLNNQTLMGNILYPTDFIDIIYSYNVNTNSGTAGVFTPSISGTGVITLVEDVSEGNVTFPVVDGHFANFDGTGGKIKDDGFLPSDATKTRVVMASAAVIANHLAVFADTTGTINDDAATAINGGNLQAGLSGTAGFLASFPATAARGSLRLVGANSAGDTVTQITNASQAAARVYTIPDGGQAASSFLLTDNAGTQTIATGNLALSAGTFTASGAITSTAGDITSGSSGNAGNFISFPATAANGTFIFEALDAGGAFNTTVRNSAMGQSSVISIPDPGAATANFIISAFATTQNITTGALQVNAGAITSGLAAGGFVGLLKAFPTTASKGFVAMQAAVNATGDFGTTISNATAQAQAQVITIPDAGAATANFLLDTGTANILAKQQFVGIQSVLTFGTGTWTTTRIAQGNYVKRHTPADETSIIGVDITPIIRAAASKGFRLDSFDVIYAIAANALDAHSVTLDRIAYADNVAVSVTSIPITATLATATQANPYVTNATVDTPAFDVTADSKYIIEVTVNNAAASEYDYYGIMLRFSETIG